MLTWFIRRRLAAFERHYGYTMRATCASCSPPIAARFSPSRASAA